MGYRVAVELLDLVTALDSPLCAALAPELFAMKDKVAEILGRYQHGCQPCQAARKQQAFAQLQIELTNIVTTNPAIEAVLPNLILTGKQAHDGHL
jgi:hypothetical protein